MTGWQIIYTGSCVVGWRHSSALVLQDKALHVGVIYLMHIGYLTFLPMCTSFTPHSIIQDKVLTKLIYILYLSYNCSCLTVLILFTIFLFSFFVILVRAIVACSIFLFVFCFVKYGCYTVLNCIVLEYFC